MKTTVLGKLFELPALPDKLQIEHFTPSPSRAPHVGRSVPTLNQWSEMSPCTQLDDMSHFASATCCIQRGAFLIFHLPCSCIPGESADFWGQAVGGVPWLLAFR